MNGTLFGTTSAGGANGRVFGGYGTVFGLSPSGNETVLYNFTGGSDGAAPFAGMYSINGTLYGAANSGGKTNAGTVFAVAPIPVR